MATISEITQAASYQGSKELGGFVPSAIEINTKPLEDLARYTLLYNQAEYNQRQKDAEMRAEDLAKIAEFDFSKVDEQWRVPISEKFNELTDYVRNNPDVFNYQKNPKGWFEYKRLKNEVNQAVTSGGANQALLEGRKEAIRKETDVSTKSLKEKELEKDKATTGLFDKLPIEEEYKKMDFAALPKGQQTTFDVLQIDPNSNTTRTYKLLDMGQINSAANIIELDMTADALDVNSDAFKNALPEEQSRLKSEDERRGIAKKNGWMKVGEIANTILNNEAYYTDGKVDINKLLADSKTAPLANMVVSVNEKIALERKKIESGQYKDKKGNKVIFDGKFLNPNDYVEINIQDGISGAEVAKMMMIAQAPSNIESTKVQETDDALQYAQLAEQRRNNNLDFQVQWKNAETAAKNAEGGKGTAKTGTGIETPAILFGRHIERVKNGFKGNSNFRVSYAGVDENTRKATGMEDEDVIEYRKDGTFLIIDKEGKSKKTGTLEELKQGYINAVKSMQSETGVQTPDFQKAAEQSFLEIFGTTDGISIFNNWSQSTEKKGTGSNKDGGSETKMSDAEYQKFLKENGL